MNYKEYQEEMAKRWRRVMWLSLAAAICAGIAAITNALVFAISKGWIHL